MSLPEDNRRQAPAGGFRPDGVVAARKLWCHNIALYNTASPMMQSPYTLWLPQ